MRALLLAAIASVTICGAAAAQPGFADTSRYAVSLSYGVFEYDLSDVGDVRMAALRVERPLSKYAIAEGGILYARPRTQGGDTTNFFVAELQVQAQLPLPIVTPYIGLGGGVALDFGRERLQATPPNTRRATDPTFSASAGLRSWFTDVLGARTELRVRGIGGEFQGSSSEWTIGVILRV
jgi:hypothetical protein